MFLERTPNELVNTLSRNTVINKTRPDMETVGDAVKNLPISASEYEGVVGVGDYNRSRSSEGSCVLGYKDSVVVKISLGTHDDNTFEKAKNMMLSVKQFTEVAPATLVMIAKVDGNIVKPIIVQKRIDGRPVCDTPINRLFSLKALYGMREVARHMDDWYIKSGCHDLCGQQTKRSFLGKVAQFIPLLSDNIMIDTNNKVYLTDNVSDVTVPDKKGVQKFIPRKLLNRFPVLFLNTLIVGKKIYNLLTKNKEEFNPRIVYA